MRLNVVRSVFIRLFLCCLFFNFQADFLLGSASESSARLEGGVKVLYPEDLGPSQIDVSAYPASYQQTYRKILLPLLEFLGGPARVINLPLIELDLNQEALERQRNPELFSDPLIAQVSRDAWKQFVEKIRLRPPCCGACPVISRKEAKALWQFLVYDSLIRKTGHSAQDWIRHRKKLVERFQKDYSYQRHSYQMNKEEKVK